MATDQGARVERQLTNALDALHSGSASLIAQILRHEAEVNALERAIDEYGGQIVARRIRRRVSPARQGAAQRNDRPRARG